MQAASDSESGNGYHAELAAPAAMPEEVAGSGVLPAGKPAATIAVSAPAPVRPAVHAASWHRVTQRELLGA